MAVFEAIATTYLAGTAASVEFTSIPATYEHLQLRVSGRQNSAGSAGGNFHIRFNGDTGTNYSNHTMQTYGGTSINADGYTGFAYVYLAGRLSGPTSDAAQYATTIIDIADYANTNKNTTMMAMSESISASNYLVFLSALWDNTAAVTTILLYPSSASFARGSEFTLYGLNSA
jgi:hypothetical protein